MAILPAFPFVLNAQKKQFICIFLMKSIAKSMLYQKELLYLAKMKTGLNLVCMHVKASSSNASFMKFV